MYSATMTPTSTTNMAISNMFGLRFSATELCYLVSDSFHSASISFW